MCQQRQKSAMFAALYGTGEIQREPHVHHARQADRHVGIAGEIEVDLQRIGRRRIPRLDEAQRRALCRGGEAHVGEVRERVRQHELLRQAEQEDRQPLGDVVRARHRKIGGQQLRHDLARPHDRTGDQVRKERDEGGIGQQAGIDAVAASALGQEHDLLEGEEADRQRQEDVEFGRVQPEHAVDEEVGVFEPAQQRQVCGDARDQPAPRRALPAAACQTQDMLAEPVIDQDRSGQQQDEFRVPPAVEEQAGRDQPAQCPACPSDTSSQEEPGQRDRQEAQHELGCIEQHGVQAGVSGRRHNQG